MTELALILAGFIAGFAVGWGLQAARVGWIRADRDRWIKFGSAVSNRNASLEALFDERLRAALDEVKS